MTIHEAHAELAILRESAVRIGYCTAAMFAGIAALFANLYAMAANAKSR